MRTSNIKTPVDRTYNGAPTFKRLSAEEELRSAVLTCLLWENEFYRSGTETADRIRQLATALPFETVAKLALEARTDFKLRHVPLWLLVSLIDSGHKGNKVSEVISSVIQRPDEMVELLSLYWKDGKKKLPKQLKVGLAKAFGKFNEYSLAKFDKPGTISLRDVMFLTHPKPENEEREALYYRIANKSMKTPDTWEVALSAGADKKATWERLIEENKLGPQATLKNLRNMTQAGVEDNTIRKALRNVKAERVLPFEFLTAAKYAPRFEPEIEELMFKCLDTKTLKGTTVLLIDYSGSMHDKISSKSELTRWDAAVSLGLLMREECDNARVFKFAMDIVELPPRRGFGLRDALGHANGGGTELGGAVSWINKNVKYDRLVVLTDEQSHDIVPGPVGNKGYMINVATYEKTITNNAWHRIAGWSEKIVEYVKHVEGYVTQ